MRGRVQRSRRTIKALKIKTTLRFALPKTEVVRAPGSVPGNHHVISNSEYLLPTTPRRAASALAPSLGIPIKSDLVGDVQARELPRVLVLEPGIRCLELRSVIGLDELLENAVLVTEAIAPNGKLLCCRRIEIACGEATKAAISECSVALLHEYVLEAEAE